MITTIYVAQQRGHTATRAPYKQAYKLVSAIDEKIAEMEAGLMKRILLNGSGIFYKICNIYFASNCPGTNCRAELSCAELSGIH